MVHKGDLQVRVWQVQRDVMNDTVATEDQEQPAGCHQRKARVADRDPGRRTSSGPADICSAPTEAGHMTAADPIRSKRQKSGPGRRTSSGPADICSAPTEAGHMTAADPIRSKRQKSACHGGPSTYDDLRADLDELLLQTRQRPILTWGGPGQGVRFSRA